jgi:hypothetical protein
MVSGVFENFVLWEVPGSNPVDSKNILQSKYKPIKGGTRGAPALGHVSSFHSLPIRHVSTSNWSTTVQPNKCTTSPIRHVSKMVRPSTWPYGLYGQVQSASQIFTCLTWRSNRDISSIRTPFAKINIPPESGKRDGRNGTVFISFRAL